MLKYLEDLKLLNPSLSIWNRSMTSLVKEWKGHNLLYDLHLFRSHTADVDFEYPQKWYYKVAWDILSIFY